MRRWSERFEMVVLALLAARLYLYYTIACHRKSVHTTKPFKLEGGAGLGHLSLIELLGISHG